MTGKPRGTGEGGGLRGFKSSMAEPHDGTAVFVRLPFQQRTIWQASVSPKSGRDPQLKEVLFQELDPNMVVLRLVSLSDVQKGAGLMQEHPWFARDRTPTSD